METHSAPLPSESRPTSDPAGQACSIATRGLRKVFGSRAVVDGVSIEVAAGEIVGLLGPNGAGKTTTFYSIVGLMPVSGGSVFINGIDATHLRMHRRARLGVGYLPQEPSVFRKLTVEQNVLAIVEHLPIPADRRRGVVEDQLKELGLTHLAGQKAYTLSGGERRRLEIARALVTQPRFLLMDEPFSGVDPISVADVQKIVLELKQRGIGILITDHNVRETLRIVDRAYLIHEGKVLREGSSDFLINDAKSREIYLGQDFNL